MKPIAGPDVLAGEVGDQKIYAGGVGDARFDGAIVKCNPRAERSFSDREDPGDERTGQKERGRSGLQFAKRHLYLSVLLLQRGVRVHEHILPRVPAIAA